MIIPCSSKKIVGVIIPTEHMYRGIHMLYSWIGCGCSQKIYVVVSRSLSKRCLGVWSIPSSAKKKEQNVFIVAFVSIYRTRSFFFATNTKVNLVSASVGVLPLYLATWSIKMYKWIHLRRGGGMFVAAAASGKGAVISKRALRVLPPISISQNLVTALQQPPSARSLQIAGGGEVL